MLDVTTETAATLRTPSWHRTATRWAQLTLVEDDPIRFDPDRWIDIFRETRSNAVCLSAGGYIAYYPSRVPFHYVSRHVSSGDPFGYLVDGARALGMHVMARVDPHAIHEEAARAHPEWIAVDADGRPRRHWAFPEVWVTCAYGDYNARYMPEILREVARDYDVDAIFANRWQGHGVCYCASCRERFAGATGLELPRTQSVEDPAWIAWQAWRRDVLTRLVVEWDEVVKAERPHASFIPNMGGSSLMEFDTALIEDHCPFLCVDDQGRMGTAPIWRAGRNGKRIRATFPDRQVVLITSVGPEHHLHRWKDSVNTAAEIEAWIDDGTAQGMLPWFTKFNGVIPDDRWIAPVAQAFARAERIEAALAGLSASAEIAVLDATTTLRNWAWEERHLAEAEEMGIYHALVEARLPFEFVSDQRLTPERLDAFRLLILPDVACLSDEQCGAIRAFVARGGAVLATGETSLRDEKGATRSDFGLGDVLGARLAGAPRGPLKNTYVVFTGAGEASGAVAAGFEGARRIIGGTRIVPIEAAPGAGVPLLCVPDFPDLPMEEVYPREAPRDPALVLTGGSGGRGRTAYLPWNLGATFHDVLAADHSRLLANVVRWLLGEAFQVEVEGPGVVEVALREGEGAAAVLLMNLTNPMMMKGPIREAWPVGAQEVSMALPDERTGAVARLVLAGTELPVRIEAGRARVTVPGLSGIEAVRFDWR